MSLIWQLSLEILRMYEKIVYDLRALAEKAVNKHLTCDPCFNEALENVYKKSFEISEVLSLPLRYKGKNEHSTCNKSTKQEQEEPLAQSERQVSEKTELSSKKSQVRVLRVRDDANLLCPKTCSPLQHGNILSAKNHVQNPNLSAQTSTQQISFKVKIEAQTNSEKEQAHKENSEKGPSDKDNDNAEKGQPSHPMPLMPMPIISKEQTLFTLQSREVKEHVNDLLKISDQKENAIGSEAVSASVATTPPCANDRRQVHCFFCGEKLSKANKYYCYHKSSNTSRYDDRGKPNAKVFVEDMRPGTTAFDLEELFQKFGPIRHCWVAWRDVESGTRIPVARIRVHTF